ncbi:adaptor protein MecA [Planococcus lenghuensis]|uniref:Adapter protein MecA n=1 Tax=Planococcus lenghuensis TaxID=2213202 RepID=A0A1Q2L0F4_9BACL|nr:adaptor protein MecA [Planococcus lenghuensis]AQQ53911.1 adaptor protein MecA [Planococcus lenghuensis]
MDIERVNDNTVKFYISYVDVEERGFTRDEIWFNKEKSEELFWEMMDEVHEEADFEMEGPLWIQVQAMDKGLEVTVTKAQLTKDGQKMDIPGELEERRKMFMGEENPEFDDYDAMFDQHTAGRLDYTFVLSEVEELVPVARNLKYVQLDSKLYFFEGKYYLYVSFDEIIHSDEDVQNYVSIISEHLDGSMTTIHRLQEYGKEIFADHALTNTEYYFG